MNKKRPLNADEQFILNIIGSAERLSPRQILVAWARERGVTGNVIAWPRDAVDRALRELLARDLVGGIPKQQAGGSAA